MKSAKTSNVCQRLGAASPRTVAAHARLDMVPVDYAATAILELLFAKRQHDVYHVSSGLERSPSTADLAAAFSSAFVSLPPFRFLAGASAAAWAKGIRGCSLDASRLAEVCDYLEYWIRTFGDERRMLALLSALSLFSVYGARATLRQSSPPPRHGAPAVTASARLPATLHATRRSGPVLRGAQEL